MGQYSLIYECNDCTNPCRLEIMADDEKLPRSLTLDTLFRNRSCPCNPSMRQPNWKKIEESEFIQSMLRGLKLPSILPLAKAKSYKLCSSDDSEEIKL
jgi:hypothetical protein